MSRRWVVRAGVLAALVGCLYVGFARFDYAPRLLPLALLATVCVAVTWLVIDVLGDLGPGWDVAPTTPSAVTGQDARLATYLRVVEGHATSNAPDGALRDRLARLADQQLMRRHGIRRDDPRALDHLGQELQAMLDGPPRRLGVAEMDRHVRRIEEL